MPDGHVLLAFAAASMVTMVIPGPAVVYVVARSVAHGRIAGLYSMLGLETGAAAHVLLAIVGVAALIQASPTAFTALTWIGAGYLGWIAVRELLSLRESASGGPERSAPNPRRLYWDGVLVDLLNPKTALFFLAFLPQFVDPSRGSVSSQTAVLGAVFVVIACACDSTYAVLAGRLSSRLRTSVDAQRRLKIASASVYLALAVVAVTI